jgi:hypothetical protein
VSSDGEAEFDDDATEDEEDLPTVSTTVSTTARTSAAAAAAATAAAGAAGAADATLWPSALARQQWLQAVRSASTVSALALGFTAFVEAAAK